MKKGQMKKVVAGVLCVVLLTAAIGAAFAEPVVNAKDMLYRYNQEAVKYPTIWYSWDTPEWSYMPFWRYMEDWFKPVKLPIQVPVFEIGEPMYL